MEQTVNSFLKGLQLDSHPMVLDNLSLSDALNATFITLNGNEIILQNDMGNRRIDNAFLPSGYLPLGIKEYGGVIYVAAYNPLTNRGQVGSFPSPLRKININNEGGKLDFDNFIKENDEEYSLVYDYLLVPISDKIVLHTGDKFSIYSKEIGNILQYLTLPSDIKNNLFTFLIGIFNSLNEFVDITDKLKLWDVKNINGETKQYFINFEKPDSFNIALNDSELIKLRNRIAINTYSLKMSSPLYLKAIVNHINNISYSISGEKTSVFGSYKLDIEINYYYNCIDEIEGKTFQVDFNGELLSSENNSEPLKVEEFDEYQRTIIYNHEINQENNIFDYTIKFPLLHNYPDWTGNTIYIDSLTKKGSINLSKLNSDEIDFKGYRYYNDLEKRITTLDINIESYPKKGSNLGLQAYLCIGTKEILIKTWDNPGIGTLSTSFLWSDIEESENIKIENRKLYYLKFYSILNNNKNELSNGIFVTTGIFNGNYIGEKNLSNEDWENYLLNNDKYIKYSYDDLKNVYIEDFGKIKKILLSPKIKYLVSNSAGTSSINTTGSYILSSDSEKKETEYNVIESWDIKNTIGLSLIINNPELYPNDVDNILMFNNTENTTIILDIERRLDDNKIIKDSNDEKYKYSEGLSEDELNPEENVIVIKDNIEKQIESYDNYKKLEFTSSISVKNSVSGPLEEKTIYCEHLIIPFRNFIKDHYYSNNNTNYLILKEPYIQIDSERKNNPIFTIKNTNESDKVLEDLGNENDITYDSKNLNGHITNSNEKYIEEIIRDDISNYLNTYCKGNFLVGEFNPNDIISGTSPCYKNYNANNNEGYKRIWMKINKRDYIPIFVVRKNSYDKNILFTDDELYSTIFYNIPHYYEYETGGKNLLKKLIGTNYNRTKEFEMDSNIKLTIKTEACLNNVNNIYDLLYNNVIDLIEFKEGIIHSNESFEEDILNIRNSKVYCAILENLDNLHIRDLDGNTFDPLFVYYDDSECKDYREINSKFKKSYLAEKFYVPEFDSYMPELKSSKKLYFGKKGEDERIEEYVHEYDKIGGSRSSNINSTIYTYVLYEDISCTKYITFKTLNIFNRVTIRNYKLYNKSPLSSNNYWKDYD